MSLWIEIKKQEDVELSEDGKTIEVCYGADHNGNNYIDIPIELIKFALADDKQRIKLKSKNDGGSVCQCEGTYCNIEIEKNECWLCGMSLRK
ncbi:hypothetical protein LCGC14_0503570 [marine sediment metagenome]|uniref:Uncharacterized protein n=1 Tax=marine sediment metagenome TaxID=412755 RepID=A0A0F9S871_9ZZZZ